MGLEYMTWDEIALELGRRLKRLRIRQGLDQVELAHRAGVSRGAVQGLEAGRGSTTETLIRVLRALKAVGNLEMLAPVVDVSPMALRRQASERKRVRRARGGTP